jgi:hypothetical protein
MVAEMERHARDRQRRRLSALRGSRVMGVMGVLCLMVGLIVDALDPAASGQWYLFFVAGACSVSSLFKEMFVQSECQVEEIARLERAVLYQMAREGR